MEKIRTVEFGPRNTVLVNLSEVNEIEQIRKSYPTDKIEDLAKSILHESDDGEPTFDLYNPLMMAKLSLRQAEEYIKQHAEFYGLEVSSVNDLTPTKGGDYLILIAGHRRKRAIELLCTDHNVEKPKVMANIRQGISFEDALVAQIRENTFEKISPDELAKNIERYYSYLERQNPSVPVKITKLASAIGYSETTVRGALKYMSLPEEIRNVYEKSSGLLSYATMVHLEPLQRALQNYHRAKKINEPQYEYVVNQLFVTIHSILESKLTAKDKSSRIIRGRIQALEINSAFEQDSFLEWEKASSGEVRNDTAGRLGKLSLKTALLALKSLSSVNDPEIISSINELNTLLARSND